MHSYMQQFKIMNKPTNYPIPDSPRPLSVSILLSCGLFGSIIFTVGYIIEATLTPGYSSLHRTISDLELVKHGWLQSANFILLGLFTCLFAIGLRKELESGIGARSLPALQLLVALGLILTGIFIHEPLHTPSSMISFISLVIGFFLFAKRFRGDERWKGWATYSILSGIFMMVFLSLFGFFKHSNGPIGLYERLVVATRSLWSFLFIFRLLRGVRLTPRHYSALPAE